MSVKLIEERVKQYKLQNQQEELHALKEIFQELALASLSRSKFFRFGAFQGGTALRILHKLPRFSEDLDFVLLENNPDFAWGQFLKEMHLEFEAYGLNLEIKDCKEEADAVKKALIKEGSFKKVLTLQYIYTTPQKIQIKLEVDTEPPSGSTYETHFLEFPYPFSVTSQDLPSLFASKSHALLCRPYTKGRDWYDFIWYVSQKTIPSWPLLENALRQHGPWKNHVFEFTTDWFCDTLKKKVRTIDWKRAVSDVRPFLSLQHQKGLEIWAEDFFLALVDKILDNSDSSNSFH